MGVTAIEDKLQVGVPESIHTLLQAGIKVRRATRSPEGPHSAQQPTIEIAIMLELLLLIVKARTLFNTRCIFPVSSFGRYEEAGHLLLPQKLKVTVQSQCLEKLASKERMDFLEKIAIVGVGHHRRQAGDGHQHCHCLQADPQPQQPAGVQ